jgi:phosphoribosylanthranilate isomerase
MPSGFGPIGEEQIAAIIAEVPPHIATFLLTSATDAKTIVEQQRRAGANTLQLVDEVEPGAYAALRDTLPHVSLVQVIHVAGEQSLRDAAKVAPEVDAILLDSGNPSLAVKELGGTGRVHDWAISRRIREAVDVPVYLAGGLRAENVREAIESVRPFAVDVCTGLRTVGALDPAKLERFVTAVRAAG